jgi:hypothetical protein
MRNSAGLPEDIPQTIVRMERTGAAVRLVCELMPFRKVFA